MLAPTATTVLATLLLLPSFAAAHANAHGLHRRHHHTSPAKLAKRQGAVLLQEVDATAGANGCTAVHKVADGEYCYMLAEKFNISLDTFMALNPAVNSDCLNLMAGTEYCVSGSPSTNSTTTGAPVVSGSIASIVAAAVPVDTTPTPASLSSTDRSLADQMQALYNIVASLNAASNGAASSAAVAAASASKVSADAAYAKQTADAAWYASSSASVAAASASSKAAADAAWAASSSKNAAAAAYTPPPQVQAAAQQQQAPAPAAAAPQQASVSSVLGNVLKSAGISSFLGTNSGIGSWFLTNAASDSTNGNSWCGFPYNNQVPGFAPSVGTMLRNFGNNYEAAATAYCGLEAKFTAPDGSTSILYIADGFDDKWVLSPGSVDIVIGSFAALFGRQTNNKNDVIQNLKWEFTGNRNDQYKFKGRGSS